MHPARSIILFTTLSRLGFGLLAWLGIDPTPPTGWVAFVFFAIAIEPLGLILTIIGTTLLGAFADREARPLQSLMLAIGLALSIWVLFVVLLGLSIPVWPGAQ